jgi:hypothetical protein
MTVIELVCFTTLIIVFGWLSVTAHLRLDKLAQEQRLSDTLSQLESSVQAVRIRPHSYSERPTLADHLPASVSAVLSEQAVQLVDLEAGQLERLTAEGYARDAIRLLSTFLAHEDGTDPRALLVEAGAAVVRAIDEHDAVVREG